MEVGAGGHPALLGPLPAWLCMVRPEVSTQCWQCTLKHVMPTSKIIKLRPCHLSRHHFPATLSYPLSFERRQWGHHFQFEPVSGTPFSVFPLIWFPYPYLKTINGSEFWQGPQSVMHSQWELVLVTLFLYPSLGSPGWLATCRAPAGNPMTRAVRAAGLREDATHGCLWSDPGRTSQPEMTLHVRRHLTAGQGCLFRTLEHSIQRLLGMHLQ